MRCHKRVFEKYGLLAVALCLLGATTAWAAPAPKVQVCHIPPGNPANFQTISVSANALPAHLAHGDLTGACSAYCATLCSDGNPCTVDACDPNTGQCTTEHPPVNCDDGNLCTLDTCNAGAGGCQNAPVVCNDNDNCTVDACDPTNGLCVAPPVACPDGQSCDPTTGECVGANACESNPCVHGECSTSGGGYVCTCAPGWTGVDCEIDIDECASNPCVHGECADRLNGYTCECDTGYSGTHCEIPPPSVYNCTTNNPCTPENAAAGLFYFAAELPTQYVQCTEWGQCYVFPCSPGLVWNQSLLTCVEAGPPV